MQLQDEISSSGVRGHGPAPTGSCTTKVVRDETRDEQRFTHGGGTRRTWGWVLVGQRSCRKHLSQSFLDVDGGQFDDVCR